MTPDPIVQAFTFLGAVAGSAVLGFLKQQTYVLDGRIGQFVKPAQPLLVALASVGLPLLGNAIGLSDVPSADVFTSAPTSTLLTVVAREGWRRFSARTPTIRF